MRLPSESALSREQKEIIGAPTEGTMLVVGPPGSGKTVVAIMRERGLRNRHETVASVVFNNVLTRYTGNDLTFHSWLNDWWSQATGKRLPGGQVVDAQGQTSWAQDYTGAIALAAGGVADMLRARGHWGHLILDEAQDFDREAHRLLFHVQQRVFAHLPEDERPSICILADENQRITSSNSTIEQIRQAHAFLSKNDEYKLTRNYRNTRQIAEFAAHFYVGLSSGKPELPAASGDLPRVGVATLDEGVARIVTHAKNRPNDEIGVFVQYNATRKKLFNKLTHRLKDTKIRVQTYGVRPEEHRDVSQLRFERPGTVTVLCFASAKGLEFDAVFLPELQALRLDGAERDQVRMNLYVMCSRARSHLTLFVDDGTREHEVWSLLPDRGWEEA